MWQAFFNALEILLLYWLNSASMSKLWLWHDSLKSSLALFSPDLEAENNLVTTDDDSWKKFTGPRMIWDIWSEFRLWYEEKTRSALLFLALLLLIFRLLVLVWPIEFFLEYGHSKIGPKHSFDVCLHNFGLHGTNGLSLAGKDLTRSKQWDGSLQMWSQQSYFAGMAVISGC